MTVAVTPAMGTELARQLTALERAIALCEGRLDDEALATARAVLVQAGERMKLSNAHTVVAIAGPTGCGKSSLFNAIAELSLSRVGVRRPTTARTLACAWGVNGAQPLLDWLGIPRGRQLSRETVLDAGSQVDLSGLVLLDLPDYDSTEADHQVEVDRLLDLVDVMVWVFDPEKYADALVHEDYLQALAAHAPVTICVFNQADRLDASAVRRCVADLRRLLVEDGLGELDIVTASAVTGQGVTELRRLIASRVMQRRAASDRLQADVAAISGDLIALCGDGSVMALQDEDVAALVTMLSTAAGVPATADAVADAFHRRGVAATGWPLLRLLRRAGAATSSRLPAQGESRLPVQRSTRSFERPPSGQPVRAGSVVAEAEVDTGLRSIGDVAAAGLPAEWADSVRRVAHERAAGLGDALAREVADNARPVRPRPWWSIVGGLQWAFVAAAVFGAIWVLVIGAFAVLGIDDPPMPEIAGWPAPLMLVVLGAGCGLALSAMCKAFIALSAVRARRAAEADLRTAVEQVTARFVVDPVREEQERYSSAVEQLKVAGTTADS